MNNLNSIHLNLVSFVHRGIYIIYMHAFKFTLTVNNMQKAVVCMKYDYYAII